MKTRWTTLFVCIVLSVSARAGDTNFVGTFSALWQSEDASNVLSYVAGYLSTNQNAEAYFARAVVAASLEGWGRGATNFTHQAIYEIGASTNYSAEQKSALSNRLSRVQSLFSALAYDADEPHDSTPSWDTNVHAVIFSETGGEVPFFDILNLLVETDD